MNRTISVTSLCVVLIGCATTTPHFKQEDERVAMLIQMGKDQADEIEKLKGRVETLEAHRAAPRVSVKKLIPSPRAEPPQDLDEFTGEVVADSRHEPMHLYFRAFQALENGHPDEALQHLEQFLIIQPNHVYADRAQFLIAEAQFRSHEYGLALTEYQALERKFPYSFKVPESMFQRALILLQMDQKEGARALFRELLSKYPTHPTAKMALRKVTELQAPELIENAQN